MQREDHVSVIRSLLAAFATNDRALMDKAVTPDLVYHVPGHSPLAGDYHGLDAVLQLFQTFAEMLGGTLQVSAHDLMANDSHGVVMLKESAQRNGRHLDFEVIDVYHFRDGRISEAWTTPHDQARFDEFLS